MPCAPLRLLSNKDNLIRDAILAASSVKPAENTVIPIAAARTGSASVALTGSYTGDEDATLDIEIVDTDVADKLPSTPVFNGSGSGTLTDIDATGFAAQTVTVELKDAGIPILSAKLAFEGVQLVAKDPGADGNNIRINIDQSGLTFTAQDFSLLTDLKAGDGGPTSGLTGAAYEWDTKVAAADDVIPADAHRIAFGDDRSAVYLSYKQYVDNDWRYHFVPALIRDVPRGTVVKFVTGGRDVTITDYTASPATVETYLANETVYDLLHAVKEASALVTINGIVAFDRTPTGQAARELLARTDAHTEPSYGTGSVYATGFSAAFASSDAATELITAHCYAATIKDHPLAHLGAERWEVKSSLRGKLADAVTGVTYVGDTFGFVIPVKLPPGYGAHKGNYSVVDIIYMVRNDNEPPYAPICPVLSPLGPAAVDQTITVTYARRPIGNCNCDTMPTPAFSNFCLGIDGGSGDGTMSFSPETRARLVDLRDWFADTVRANSTNDDGTSGGNGNAYDQAPLISKPVTRHPQMLANNYRVINFETSEDYVTGLAADSTRRATGQAVVDSFGDFSYDAVIESNWRNQRLLSYTPFDTEPLKDMVDRFARALADIDALEAGTESPDPKVTAEEAWDIAVAEMKSDVEDQLNPPAVTYEVFGNEVVPETGIAVNPSESVSDGNVVLVYRVAGTETELAVRQWVPGIPGAIGFLRESGSVTSPATPVTVYFSGVNGNAVAEAAIEPGELYGASLATPGVYVKDGTHKVGTGVGLTEVYHDVTNAGLTASAGGTANRLAILADRYRSRIEWVLTSGGIDPLGKSSASILESGDGCWRDTGDANWWLVVGSEGKEYAPAFTNTNYYSSKRADAKAKYYSTHEFGFRINVKCPNHLKVGDQFILAIGDAAWPPTYQVGDELFLPIIAGADLRLAGGQDGNNTQQWFVTGSVAGPLPVYSLNTDTPLPYSSGGLTFLITQGGIPFVVGDKFTWTIEGGHFKWRVNTGAWTISSPLDPIPVGPVLLYEGLSATFTTGNASSFAVGDRYSFKLLQPRAASNITTPGVEAWQCDGDDQSFVFDFGSALSFDQLAIALHTIPVGATITVEAGTTAGVYPDSTTLTRREGAIYKQLDAAWTARYVRLTLNDAPDAMIGWFFVGSAVMTELSADLQLSKAWKINRGVGLFGGGAYLGQAVNGSVEWTEASLSEEDVESLQAAFDYSKSQGDEPILIVPNPTRPEKAFLGRVAADEVDWPDISAYQADAGKAQRFAAKLPLSGVFY